MSPADIPSEILPQEDKNPVPVQYRGIPSDVLDEIWVQTIYTDPAKTQQERERKQRALAYLRQQEAAAASQKTSSSEADEVEGYKRAAYTKNNLDGANTDLMITQIDPALGERFDAHGITKTSIPQQLDHLFNLLDNGIDTTRAFHTAPLEVPPELRAGLGAGFGTAGGSATKDGSFVVMGAIDRPLTESGIRYVIVNDAYYAALHYLQKKYPKVQFIRADEVNERLQQIAAKK